MNKLPIPNVRVVSESEYQSPNGETTGKNFVIEHANGNRLSMSKTNDGLIDIQGDSGKIIYTGFDEKEAAQTAKKYLTHRIGEKS